MDVGRNDCTKSVQSKVCSTGNSFMGFFKMEPPCTRIEFKSIFYTIFTEMNKTFMLILDSAGMLRAVANYCIPPGPIADALLSLCLEFIAKFLGTKDGRKDLSSSHPFSKIASLLSPSVSTDNIYLN